MRKVGSNWLRMGMCCLALAGGCGDDGPSPQTATPSLGPEGGSLELDDGASIELPAGAVPKGTTVLAERITRSPAPLPDGLELAGAIYAFTPHGTQFEKAAHLELPERASGRIYTLADEDDQSWEPVAGVKLASQRFSFDVDHISFFAELVETSSAGTGGAAGQSSVSPAGGLGGDEAGRSAGGAANGGEVGNGGEAGARCGHIADVTEPVFEELGRLGAPALVANGLNTWASAVSDDGSTVVGASHVTATETRAFRWTQQGGMQDLSTPEQTLNGADLVNCDGSVVAAYTASNPAHWFTWTELDGAREIARCEGFAVLGMTAMNGAGNVLGGQCQNGIGSVARRWLDPTSEPLPLAAGIGWINDVSDDGNFFLGTNANLAAFRWSEAAGAEAIGVNGNGRLTADGRCVFIYDGETKQHLRWCDGEVTPIPLPEGIPDSEPFLVNRDGTVALIRHGYEVWLWREGVSPSVLLKDVLAEAGVDFQGWDTVTYYDMTPDARVLVGTASLASDFNQTAAFRLVLPAGTL